MNKPCTEIIKRPINQGKSLPFTNKQVKKLSQNEMFAYQILLLFFKILFIYLTEKEHKQGELQREREKQVPH